MITRPLWMLALSVCLATASAAQAQTSAPQRSQPAPAQPQAAQPQGSDALFTAVIRDNGSAIERLLQQGQEPNVRDAKGQTPMVLALQLGNMNAFNALMASPRTNVEFRNSNDESPLMIAAIRGNLEAVTRLERQGAHVNKTLWTPLHYAASGTSEAQVRITDFLLEKHAFIDAKSPNGTTPLMMAAQYGTEGVVHLLIESNADPLMKNQLGMTAVDFAKRAGRDSLAQELERYTEQVRQHRSRSAAARQ